MFLKKILVASVAVLALAAITYAQHEQTPTQEKMGSSQEGPREGRRHRGIARHRGFAGLSELNLTEEQREQQRSIRQRQLENTKAQREELFKLREKKFAGTLTSDDETRVQTLRREIQDSRQRTRTEMQSVLTAEQRAKLEQFKAERKARRDEMREHRRKRREQRETMPR